MTWTIDNSKPIYIQLMDNIKLKLIKGEYKAGDKIDSVRDLASNAGVNPNTMQKALTELEREELIFSQRTSGRYVTENKEKIIMLKYELANTHIREFVNNMDKLGYTIDDIIKIMEEIANEQSN